MNLTTNELELMETKKKKTSNENSNITRAQPSDKSQGRHQNQISIVFFANGLCKDPVYYKMFLELGPYYVAKLNAQVLFDDDMISETTRDNAVQLRYMAEVYITQSPKPEDCHFYPFIGGNNIIFVYLYLYST